MATVSRAGTIWDKEKRHPALCNNVLAGSGVKIQNKHSIDLEHLISDPEDRFLSAGWD